MHEHPSKTHNNNIGTYPQPGDQARPRMSEKMLDVTRDTDTRRSLRARVKHAHNPAKLGILDNAEGAVTARAPKRQEIAILSLRIGRAGGERRESLGLGGLRRLARTHVAQEVAR